MQKVRRSSYFFIILNLHNPLSQFDHFPTIKIVFHFRINVGRDNIRRGRSFVLYRR